MDKEDKMKYYQQMNYENLLGQQINRIATAVSNNDYNGIRGSIYALAHLMPPKTRSDVMKYIAETGLTREMLAAIGANRVEPNDFGKLFDIWDYCSDILDKCGLLFKVSRGVEEYGEA